MIPLAFTAVLVISILTIFFMLKFQVIRLILTRF